MDSGACLFCEIAAGRIPCYKVWESDTHLAFLTPFPNTRGFTVVIPKAHAPSYVFDVPADQVAALMEAARTVAKLLDKKLGNARTATIFEGFGVDHLHAKLFPMNGVAPGQPWVSHNSSGAIKDVYFETYQGYVSSHDGHRADDAELAALAKMLRE